MTARCAATAAPAAEPLRLFAIADADGAFAMSLNGHVMAFRDRGHADAEVGDAGRVVELIEIPPPAARETTWGDGQFNDVHLSPGIRAALRVTPDGRVKLTSPGGPLDVTDGAGQLGMGLLEAASRAARIREGLLGKARRDRSPPLCTRCGESLVGYTALDGGRYHRLCPAGPALLEGGELCQVAPAEQSAARRGAK